MQDTAHESSVLTKDPSLLTKYFCMGPLVTNAMQDRDDVFTLAQIDNFTELDNQIAVLKI